MNRLLGIAFAAIVTMMALAGVLGRSEPDRAVAPELAKAGHSDSPAALPEAALALKRDGSGQFHIGGEVNGTPIRFLVDTGADVVALSEESAETAGIAIDPGSFQPIMQTASGTGYGAPIVLDTLQLGESEFHNVDAVVVQGLGTDLLGQNVLRKLGRVTLQGDRMIIQPK